MDVIRESGFYKRQESGYRNSMSLDGSMSRASAMAKSSLRETEVGALGASILLK